MPPQGPFPGGLGIRPIRSSPTVRLPEEDQIFVPEPPPDLAGFIKPPERTAFETYAPPVFRGLGSLGGMAGAFLAPETYGLSLLLGAGVGYAGEKGAQWAGGEPTNEARALGSATLNAIPLGAGSIPVQMAKGGIMSGAGTLIDQQLADPRGLHVPTPGELGEAGISTAIGTAIPGAVGKYLQYRGNRARGVGGPPPPTGTGFSGGGPPPPPTSPTGGGFSANLPTGTPTPKVVIPSSTTGTGFTPGEVPIVPSREGGIGATTGTGTLPVTITPPPPAPPVRPTGLAALPKDFRTLEEVIEAIPEIGSPQLDNRITLLKDMIKRNGGIRIANFDMISNIAEHPNLPEEWKNTIYEIAKRKGFGIRPPDEPPAVTEPGPSNEPPPDLSGLGKGGTTPISGNIDPVTGKPIIPDDKLPSTDEPEIESSIHPDDPLRQTTPEERARIKDEINRKRLDGTATKFDNYFYNRVLKFEEELTARSPQTDAQTPETRAPEDLSQWTGGKITTRFQHLSRMIDLGGGTIEDALERQRLGRHLQVEGFDDVDTGGVGRHEEPIVDDTETVHMDKGLKDKISVYVTAKTEHPINFKDPVDKAVYEAMGGDSDFRDWLNDRGFDDGFIDRTGNRILDALEGLSKGKSNHAPIDVPTTESMASNESLGVHDWPSARALVKELPDGTGDPSVDSRIRRLKHIANVVETRQRALTESESRKFTDLLSDLRGDPVMTPFAGRIEKLFRTAFRSELPEHLRGKPAFANKSRLTFTDSIDEALWHASRDNEQFTAWLRGYGFSDQEIADVGNHVKEIAEELTKNAGGKATTIPPIFRGRNIEWRAAGRDPFEDFIRASNPPRSVAHILNFRADEVRRLENAVTLRTGHGGRPIVAYDATKNRALTREDIDFLGRNAATQGVLTAFDDAVHQIIGKMTPRYPHWDRYISKIGVMLSSPDYAGLHVQHPYNMTNGHIFINIPRHFLEIKDPKEAVYILYNTMLEEIVHSPMTLGRMPIEDASMEMQTGLQFVVEKMNFQSNQILNDLLGAISDDGGKTYTRSVAELLQWYNAKHRTGGINQNYTDFAPVGAIISPRAKDLSAEAIRSSRARTIGGEQGSTGEPRVTLGGGGVPPRVKLPPGNIPPSGKMPPGNIPPGGKPPVPPSRVIPGPGSSPPQPPKDDAGWFRKGLREGRQLKTSFDASFPLRQGITNVTRKEFWSAAKTMATDLHTEGNYQKLMNEIHSNPGFNSAKNAGIEFTELGKDIDLRPEDLRGTWVEKNLPGIRWSNRMFDGMSNKLRMDIWNRMVADFKKAGVDIGDGTSKEAKALAKFINDTTGRGNLPERYKGAINFLNDYAFAPRFIASRLRMLKRGVGLGVEKGLDPRAAKILRKEGIRSMVGVGGIAAASIALTQMINGDDPNSKPQDIGKIRIGNTRVDLTGGFQSYVRVASQLYNEVTNGDPAAWRTAIRFIRGKLAPFPAGVSNLLERKNVVGDPFQWAPSYSSEEGFHEGAVLDQVLPLIATDVIELANEHSSMLPVGVPAAFLGASVDTYEDNPIVDRPPRRMRLRGTTARPPRMSAPRFFRPGEQ